MKKAALYLGFLTVGLGLIAQTVFAQSFFERAVDFFDGSASGKQEIISPTPITEIRETNEDRSFLESVTSFFNASETGSSKDTFGKFQDFRFTIPFAPEFATITPPTPPDSEISRLIQDQIFATCPDPGQIATITPACSLDVAANSNQTYTLLWGCKGFKECIIEKNGVRFFSVNDGGFITLPIDKFPAGTKTSDALVNLNLRAFGEGAQSIISGQYVVLGASNPNSNHFNPVYNGPQVFTSTGLKVMDAAVAGEIYKFAVQSSNPTVPVSINANTVNVPSGTQICSQPAAPVVTAPSPSATQAAAQCKQIEVPPGTYSIYAVKRLVNDSECPNCYSVAYGLDKPLPYVLSPDSTQVPNGPILRAVIDFAQKEILASGADPLKIPFNSNSANPVIRSLASNGVYRLTIAPGTKTNLIGGLYSYSLTAPLNPPITTLIKDFKNGLEPIEIGAVANLLPDRSAGTITDSTLSGDIKNIIKNLIYNNSYSFGSISSAQQYAYISPTTPSIVREYGFQRAGSVYVSPSDCGQTQVSTPPRCKKEVPPGAYKVVPKDVGFQSLYGNLLGSNQYISKLVFIHDDFSDFNPVHVLDSSGRKVTDLDIAKEVIRIANENIWASGLDPRSIIYYGPGATQAMQTFKSAYSNGYPVTVPAGVTTDPVRGYFKIYGSTEAGLNPPPETRPMLDLYKGARVIDPEVVKAVWDITQRAQISPLSSTDVAPPTGNEKITILAPVNGGEVPHNDPVATGDPARVFNLKWKVEGITNPKDYKVVIKDTYEAADFSAPEVSSGYPVKITAPTPNSVLTFGQPTKISWSGGRGRVDLKFVQRDFSSAYPYVAYQSVYFPASTPFNPYMGQSGAGYAVFGDLNAYVRGTNASMDTALAVYPNIGISKAEAPDLASGSSFVFRSYIARNLPPNGSFTWDGKTLCDVSGKNCTTIDRLSNKINFAQPLLDHNLQMPGALVLVAASEGGLSTGTGTQTNCGSAFVSGTTVGNICNSSFAPIVVEKVANTASRKTAVSSPVVNVTADVTTATWNRGLTYDLGKHTLEAQLFDKNNRIVARDIITVNAVVPRIEITSPLPGDTIDITKPLIIRWNNKGFDPKTQFAVMLTEFLNGDYYKNPWLPYDTKDQTTHQNLPLFMATNLVRADGSYSNRVEAGDGSVTVNLLDNLSLLKRTGVLQQTTLRQFMTTGGKINFPLISISSPNNYSGVVTGGSPVKLIGDPNATPQVTAPEVEFWVSKVEGIANAGATVTSTCPPGTGSYEKCFKYSGTVPANTKFTVSWKAASGFAGCVPYQGGAAVVRKDGNVWVPLTTNLGPYYPSSGEESVVVKGSSVPTTIFLGLQCGPTFREAFPQASGKLLTISVANNQLSAPPSISPLSLSFKLNSIENESSTIGFSGNHFVSYPVLKAIPKGKKFIVSWSSPGASKCDFSGSKVLLSRGGYWNEVVGASGSGQEELIAEEAGPAGVANAGTNARAIMLHMRCYDNNGNSTVPENPNHFLSLRFSTTNTASIISNLKNGFAALFGGKNFSASSSLFAQVLSAANLASSQEGLKYTGITAATVGGSPWVYIADRDVPQSISSRPICSASVAATLPPPPPAPLCKAVPSGSYTIFGASSQNNPNYLNASFSQIQVFGPDRSLVTDKEVSDYVHSIYRNAPSAPVAAPVSGTNVFVPPGIPMCSASGKLQGIVGASVPVVVPAPPAKSALLSMVEALWFKNQDSASVSGAPESHVIRFTMPRYAPSILGTSAIIKNLPTTDVAYGKLFDQEARLRTSIEVRVGGDPLYKKGEKLKLQYSIGTGWGSVISNANLGANDATIDREDFLRLFAQYYSRAYVSNCGALDSWLDLAYPAKFKNNLSVASPSIPLPSAFGPVGSPQTYTESNPFSAENSDTLIGGKAVFDFPLELFNFQAGTPARQELGGLEDGALMSQSKVDYMCFRLVKENGQPLENSVFPVVWRDDAETTN